MYQSCSVEQVNNLGKHICLKTVFGFFNQQYDLQFKSLNHESVKVYEQSAMILFPIITFRKVSSIRFSLQIGIHSFIHNHYKA